MSKPTSALVPRLAETAVILDNNLQHNDALISAIGDSAKVVMIGEASHGTKEFYEHRAALSKRLITEPNSQFAFIAIEGDWPDVYAINRYVKCLGDSASLEQAFAGFERFPRWMWRNETVLEFVKWLRTYNSRLEPSKRIGFYGLDMYSLFNSAENVISYLAKVDPEACEKAKHRYACFDRYADDPQAYAYATAFNMSKGCRDEAIKQLCDITKLIQLKHNYINGELLNALNI